MKKDLIASNKRSEKPSVGLNQLNDGTNRRNVPLQDVDQPRNDPHLIPRFAHSCSGTFPEPFRSVSVSVGSR